MKKIVFIINNFSIGGTEKFLYDLIKNFDKDKFQISIVSTWGSGPMEKDFQDLGLPIYFIGPRGTFSNIFEKIFSVFGTTFRLVIFLKKSKSDIVITSLYQSDILGIFTAWLVGIKKRIFIQHDIKQLNFFIKIIKKIFVVNLATGIIANSSTTKDFLTSYWKASADKVNIIKNGIDISKIEEGIKKEHDQKEIVLGIIGRLEPVKGHIVLLKALKLLKDKYNLSPKIFFIGDGNIRQQLESFIKKNDLKNIQITGMVLDVIEKLKLIDILIMPSLSEGFGLAAIEGIFSQKVVVASDLPAIREIIINKENGLLFESKNSEQLANILYRLLSDSIFYRKIKKQTKTWISKERNNLDIRNVILEYEKLF